MKRKTLLGAAAALALATAALAAASRMTVNVEQAKIRARKQFFAPVVASVKFGDKVEVGEHEDGWYAVTFGGHHGYLHESALGARAAKAGDGDWSGSDAAENDDVTLAGKGFNDDVEKAYRGSHGSLDYADVDNMEKRAVSDAVLERFMRGNGTLPRGDR